MGFFDDLWDGVKNTANSIAGGVKDAAVSVYHTVAPAVTSVYEAVAPVVTKAVNGVVSVGERVVNRLDDYAGVPLKVADSFNNILSSPIFLIGGLVVGGIVLTKMIK